MGNPWRCDDAAGLAVARRLEGTLPLEVELLEREGEPTALIDAWEGATRLWLVDAVSSGAAPGTVHRLDASSTELPTDLFRRSTHHVGVAEAVELARVLGRLPGHTVVFGIEGGSFEIGDELTPPVAAVIDETADAVRTEVAACTNAR